MTTEIILEEIWQLLKTIHDAKEWVLSPFFQGARYYVFAITGYD